VTGAAPYACGSPDHLTCATRSYGSVHRYPALRRRRVGHVRHRARARGRPFTVTSTDLAPGGRVGAAQLFDRGECNGENRSPQLSWRNPPPGTRGYAVTIFDPDAPGHGWWHWAVADLPATVTSLPANASASGFLRRIGASEARNDFGTDGYGGPCPPPGKPHRYVITVYALKGTDLRVAQGRPAPMFEHEIGTLTIGTAQLTVTYGR
jgi:Raf kinase inhibitor-like YbhB/YbcL family protein